MMRRFPVTLIFILLFPIALADLSLASRDDMIDNTLTRLESPKKFSLNKNWNTGTPAGMADTHGKFYASGGYNANHMWYREYSSSDDTNVLDKDWGNLNGFYAAVGYKSNCLIEAINGKPFIEGYFQQCSALINYEGGSIRFGDEKAKILLFGLKVGAYKEYAEKGELSFYFDVGRRIWHRGQNRIIQGAVDYYEKYWWTYFGIGAGINYEVVPSFSVGIEGEAMLAPDKFTWMYAELYEGGTFNLGTVWGGEIKIPLKYYLLKHLSLDLTPYFTYWEIEKSTTTTISGSEYYEPRSKTHVEGILAGLTCFF